jgi:uncharacterized protein
METKQNRFVIALAIMAIWMAIILTGPKLQFGGANISLDELVSHTVVFSLVLAPLFLLAVIAYFGWRRGLGLKSPEPPKSWALVWFPSIIILLFLTGAALLGPPPKSVIFYVLINTLFVGISEELMFRGVLFHGAISRFSVWHTVLITSILFGAIHSLNGFLTGDYGAALIQAGAAGMSGFWFAALRLQTNSLYPGMIMHWLWDFAVFIFGASVRVGTPTAIEPPIEPTLIKKIALPLLFALPTFLYGLWLLRGTGKRERAEFLN